MKHSRQCPKCQCHDIIVVDELRQLDAVRETDTIPVYKPFQGRPIGHLQLFACAACGYSELFAEGLQELRAAARAGGYGIRLLTMPVAPTPYR